MAVLAIITGVLVLFTWVGQNDGDRSTAEDKGPVTTTGAGTGSSSASPSPAASPSPSASGPAQVITLTAPDGTAPRLEAVRLVGEYAGAEPGTELRVQLRYPDRGWVSFPLPTAVDGAGRFATFVELGRRGDNELRVIEPGSDVTSNSVEVTVG